MVMYFQEDFWEAVNKLESTEDQDAAIVALVRYHFDKSEPTNPIANAILTVCKDRIELSKKRSKAGKTRKQSKSKTETKSNQSATTASYSYSISNGTSGNELQVDNQHGIDYILEGDDDSMEYAFAYRCIASWQTMTGRIAGTLPAAHIDTLEMAKDAYTVDDVTAMLEYKRDEWAGTDMAKHFHPSTLFKPELFHKYMGQMLDARDGAAVAAKEPEPMHREIRQTDTGEWEQYNANTKEWGPLKS